VAGELRTGTETIYIDSRMEEFMFLGLRMIKGVSRAEFKARFSKDIYEVYGPVINKYVSEGFMISEGDNVRLSDRGIDVSNIILSDFILDR
jgi:oxygen-independent coproporphyrinogen-3 oxidase